MVKNASYENCPTNHRVKDPVLAMNKAAHTLSKFRPKRSSQWKITQPNEGCVKAVHVDFCDSFTKSHDTEFVDFNQIRFCSIREFNFSHALPDVWR